MQIHVMPKPLPFGIDSRAYWAFEPTGKLVVFVHGFKGSAQATWMEFPRRLDSAKECRGCDLVFYGYDGVRTRASISASNFREFMNALCSGPTIPNKYLHSSIHRPAGLQYQKVILVGHSLGCIVIRQALLDAHLKNEAWSQRVETILFAPAHSGANVLKLLGETVTGLKVPFAGAVVPLLKIWWRVLNDLEPKNDMLNKLLKDVEAETAKAPELLATVVLHSDKDFVVEPIRFALDPPQDTLNGKSHTEICKPSDSFTDPVDIVLRRL